MAERKSHFCSFCVLRLPACFSYCFFRLGVRRGSDVWLTHQTRSDSLMTFVTFSPIICNIYLCIAAAVLPGGGNGSDLPLVAHDFVTTPCRAGPERHRVTLAERGSRNNSPRASPPANPHCTQDVSSRSLIPYVSGIQSGVVDVSSIFSEANGIHPSPPTSYVGNDID